MPDEGSRWRVVLVRLPPNPGATGAVLAEANAAMGKLFPMVVNELMDEAAARSMVERLRGSGAEAVLLEARGDVFCRTHPGELAGTACTECRAWICGACRLDARGIALCATCLAARRRRAGRVRLRQLLAALGFSLFLYGVYDHLRSEAAALDPAGPIRVAIFQFVPPELENAPIIRALNDRSGLYALQEVAAWFDIEHARYTGQRSPYVEMTVRGPWVERVEPPRVDRGDAPFWRRAWQAWRLPGYFHGLARARGVEPGDYGARIYLMYGAEEEDLASESRGSRRGRIAVTYVDTAERNPVYALVTVAHELAHQLGALDSYDEEDFLARYPEGYVQPHAVPLYPQRYAELMAVDIPTSPTSELEVRSLDQVRVGYRSAAEMGWIDAEQADLHYLPPAADPGRQLGPPVTRQRKR